MNCLVKIFIICLIVSNTALANEVKVFDFTETELSELEVRKVRGADKNIAVNAVTPAGAKTRILDQMTKEHVQRMLSKVPRGRFLEVEEFTSLVCWLSSEENTFSTAAVFDISGGRSTY